MSTKQLQYMSSWQHKHIVRLIHIIQYGNFITYMVMFWIKMNVILSFHL